MTQLNLDELERLIKALCDPAQRRDLLPLIAECRELREKVANVEEANHDWHNRCVELKAENEQYRKSLEFIRGGCMAPEQRAREAGDDDCPRS